MSHVKMNASKDLTEKEVTAVEEIRKLLEDKGWIEDRKLKSNTFLVRYLRATKFNLEKAEKLVKFYYDYIQSQKVPPNVLLKTAFPEDFSDQFKSYVGGRDNEGRPLVMIPHAGKWNLRKAILMGREQMFISYVHKVGLMIEAETLERDADYGICIMDVSNIPYANYVHRRSVEVLVELVRHMEKCAPGVLKKVYFVNAPKLWIALFAAVQAIITINAEIITYDSHDKVWKLKLREFIPEEGICPEFGGTCKNYTIV